MRHVKEGLVYELWLERALDLDVNFDKVAEQLPNMIYIYFFY